MCKKIKDMTILERSEYLKNWRSAHPENVKKHEDKAWMKRLVKRIDQISRVLHKKINEK